MKLFLIGLVVLGLYVSAGSSDYEAAQITAQRIVAAGEAKELHPCDFTFVQYGPYHEKRAPECVDVDAGPLPANVLTVPCNHDGRRCR